MCVCIGTCTSIMDMHAHTHAHNYCTSANDVAKLGHTGAHALAARGCAPPVQVRLKIISTKCTLFNRKSGAKNA